MRLKGKGKEMIEEWSNKRSDSLLIEERVLENPNAKSYELKPIITVNEISATV